MYTHVYIYMNVVYPSCVCIYIYANVHIPIDSLGLRLV